MKAKLYTDKSNESPTERYGEDPLGAKLGLAGAGILAFITRDQLHPPMVDDAKIWADAARWHKGAERHTREAARFAEIRDGERVVDVGCGIAGPARTLANRYDLQILGITTSDTMLATARRLNSRRQLWKKRIKIEKHDCQTPYPQRDFDCVFSLNMFYHLAHQRAALRCAYDALRRSGRLMIDDWMLTPRANHADRQVLLKHFGSINFAVRERLIQDIYEAGFRIKKFQDLGHIGRVHMAAHFLREFERKCRPAIEQADPQWGQWACDEFARSVVDEIDLYRDGKLTYCRVLAIK